jgi:outer membrane protein OmpA-like peptidoglycan-associated protein
MTNQRVSSARARHVRKVLIAHGIAADRIETVAKGSSEPIADNNTRAGRRRNRRVMIRCQQW